ncbi:MAG TPA: hypothetical protein VK009_05525 [Chloroflexota bacterium]|nr:hypothetical protein [Chloroflexota bacterium]
MLGDLEQLVRTTGRPKNLLVLDAIERYLREQPEEKPGVLRTYNLGMKTFNRADIYEERAEHIMAAAERQIAEERGTYRAEE